MISRFLRRQSFSRRVNLTFTRSVEGKRFSVPVFAKMGTGNLRTTELWMIDVLRRILPRVNGSFIDIGANIGQSLIKLRCVSTDILYVGIEPNPSCIFYLRELIRQNCFENCELVPVGAFSQDDLIQFTLRNDDDVDSGATVYPSGRPEPHRTQRQWAAVLPFDRIRRCLGLEAVGIMKIDVEGAELGVLQGSSFTLDHDRPFLLVEILPAYNEENSPRLERQELVTSLLASHGYSLARILKTQAGRLAALEPIRAIGVHGNLDWCDYLAYPSEKSASILTPTGNP